MSYKDGNEITIRVQCSEKELINKIKQDNFVFKSEYYTKDIFLIPKDIDISKTITREILNRAILLREFEGISSNKHKMKITFKHKNINEKGEILSQSSTNCEIANIHDAQKLFESIGYKELMIIKEKHFAYCKNGFEIIIKILSDDNILIEAETNDYYKTIEQLKERINKTNIPFDKSNYFVKKVEEELDKLKNNI
ncbi:MAG: hypothetical protein HFJ37_04335 [Clostridia bacterium]|nr:hypothetical protein [Clostridia bacterium]